MALWLDDLERLIELTEKDWNGGKYGGEWDVPPRTEEIREIAFLARRKYEMYFKYSWKYRVVFPTEVK